MDIHNYTCLVLGLEPRALCTLGKCGTSSATPPSFVSLMKSSSFNLPALKHFKPLKCKYWGICVGCNEC